MIDPDQLARVLAWLIVVAAGVSFLVMFANRANPPAFDRVEVRR